MTEDLREVVAEAVEDATEDLREQNEELRQRVDALEDENEELRQRVDALEDENEELREDIEENTTSRKRLAREQAEMNGRISTVEETVDAAESVENGEVDIDEDLSPMEQIARLPEHVAAEQFDNANHRNTFRSRSVVRDFFDYASKTPRGHVLKNPDLCRVLTAQEDARVESKTGERVMDRIEDLSKGTFEHVVPAQNRHGEHILVLEDPEDLSLGGDAAVS